MEILFIFKCRIQYLRRIAGVTVINVERPVDYKSRKTQNMCKDKR